MFIQITRRHRDKCGSSVAVVIYIFEYVVFKSSRRVSTTRKEAVSDVFPRGFVRRN